MKFGFLYPARHSSSRSSAAHSCLCGQYLCVSKQWYSCQCLRFLTWVQMLMHAIAQGDCTYTVRESALKAFDTRNKISRLFGDSDPREPCAWLTSQMLYPLSYSRSYSVGSHWRPSLLRTYIRRVIVVHADPTAWSGFSLVVFAIRRVRQQGMSF